MPTRRGWRAVVAGLIILLFIGLARAGDKDIAELLFKKGEKASRKKSYEEAVTYYRRALAEHSPYPEAASALAGALQKLGRGQEALEALLLCEEQLEVMPDLLLHRFLANLEA